jgi:hypothetical protein
MENGPVKRMKKGPLIPPSNTVSVTHGRASDTGLFFVPLNSHLREAFS